jgi:hypothetical protein
MSGISTGTPVFAVAETSTFDEKIAAAGDADDDAVFPDV